MKIISIGSAIPETVTTNDEIEAGLGLDRGWIERRTGVLQRPTAGASEATSDLAVRAGERALRGAKLHPDDIGLLLLATSTPDHLLPPTAPLVAYRLGLSQAGAVDIAGACAGFLYALTLASTYADSLRKAVLVIGANILTRRIDKSDPATVALFSDGAGAVVLAPAEPSNLLGVFLGADGRQYDTIGIPAGGSREPLTAASLEEGRHLMSIRRGSALFKQAVHAMTFAGKRALEIANLSPDAVAWWIPHQANVRITRDTGTLLTIPAERTISVIDRYGNSSAATIPIALADAVDKEKVKTGDVLLLTAAGAGMVSAGLVLRW